MRGDGEIARSTIVVTAAPSTLPARIVKHLFFRRCSRTIDQAHEAAVEAPLVSPLLSSGDRAAETESLTARGAYASIFLRVVDLGLTCRACGEER
jgi:hypothetical protein